MLSTTQPQNTHALNLLWKTVQDPQALGLVACLLLLIVLNTMKGTKKVGLARARLASRHDLARCVRLANQQIQAGKYNQVSLYIGSPRGMRRLQTHRGVELIIPADPKRLYLYNAQEGILVLGAPGCGKSFSFIDPAMRSLVDQGGSLIVFDVKGHEEVAPSSYLAGYAKARGYKVYIVAPGFAESDTLNILDGLKDGNDQDGAMVLATTLHENFKLDAGNSSNGFFKAAGQQLITALLMFAKSCADEERRDIALCHKLLALPNFAERMIAHSHQLSQWVKMAFDQFLATAGAQETAQGIAGTASIMFSRLMTPDTLAVCCGTSTVPLEVHGKTLVIFRMDPKKKQAISPMMASMMQLLINRSAFTQRRNPLGLFLDEFTEVFIHRLPDIPNLCRSNGVITCLATQSLARIEETYGDKGRKAILGGCKTQVIAQLNDLDTAKYFSDLLGEEEISYKHHSRSHGKGGAGSSTSTQQGKRPLIEISQLTTLPQGHAVVINSGIGNTHEVRVPYLAKVSIPKADIDQVRVSAQVWERLKADKIMWTLAEVPSEAELDYREVLAEQMLPSPLSKGLDEISKLADGVTALQAGF